MKIFATAVAAFMISLPVAMARPMPVWTPHFTPVYHPPGTAPRVVITSESARRFEAPRRLEAPRFFVDEPRRGTSVWREYRNIWRGLGY